MNFMHLRFLGRGEARWVRPGRGKKERRGEGKGVLGLGRKALWAKKKREREMGWPKRKRDR